MPMLTIRWSNPSTIQETGVHHGYRVAPATETDVPDDLGPARRVWWAMLEPGGYILPHIDAGPYHLRWHYPVEPAGYVWQQQTGTADSPVEPFTVQHWLPHAVWNPDDVRRVHLIVDLEEQVPDVDHNHPLELLDPGLVKGNW